ncbi:helix-turn-helix transcriptional regulator [Cryomorphaceae bacterium 1068]|nr:helix-turn-helix transcriptional regulator [Cryomorphaceae bacterium 1068]
MQNRLREIRMSENLSQQALAERTGVSRQSIHAIEKGKYVPSTELALKICRELKKKVEEIFFLD